MKTKTILLITATVVAIVVVSYLIYTNMVPKEPVVPILPDAIDMGNASGLVVDGSLSLGTYQCDNIYFFGDASEEIKMVTSTISINDGPELSPNPGATKLLPTKSVTGSEVGWSVIFDRVTPGFRSLKPGDRVQIAAYVVGISGKTQLVVIRYTIKECVSGKALIIAGAKTGSIFS